jgi:regulatory protein
LRRGVPRELVDARAESGTGELDRAVAILRQRFPAPMHARRERDRALGVLLRKGYEEEVAFEALTIHAREAA